MRNRQETYSPLFDNDEIMDIKKSICKCCGNSVNEKNITEDGFCIECVMNNIAYENKNAHPNEFLHKEFCALRRKSEFNQVFKIILYILFLPVIILLFLFISDSHKSSKIAPKKVSFENGNQTTVYIHDYNWVCPCCTLENQGPHYCKRCGVYPKFKLID